MTRTGRIRALLAVALLAAGTAACGSPQPSSPGPAAAAASSASAAPGAGDDVEREATPLIAEPTADDTARSLATLRRVDDHPLYEMTWFGPAPALATAEPNGIRGDALPPERAPFGCTTFAAMGDPAQPLFGRNFDWDPNPALIVHSEARGAYRSVSIVDLSYIGFDTANVAAIDDPARQPELMEAIRLPFDGMNEHGLAIGMAAVDDAVADVRPGRRAIGSVGVMRLVLDQARDVAEAVEVLSSYNLDFSGGPGLHYIVADATGASSVVEFIDGRTVVTPRAAGESWQVMENFHVAGDNPRGIDTRHRAATDVLSRAGGAPGVAGSLDLLRTVAQGHTQWSAVFDLKARSIDLYTDKRRDAVRRIQGPA